MPGATTCFGLPFPLGTDRLDFAGDLRRLAEAVDLRVCNQYVLKNGDTMTGPLEMSGQPILNIAHPTDDEQAATKLYVDEKGADFVKVAGDTMEGRLTLTSTNYGGADDATRRAWQIETFVQESGDTMTGDLMVGNNPVGHPGVRLYPDGAIRVVRGDGYPCLGLGFRGTNATINALPYVRFLNTDNDDVMGTITRQAPASVAYNTTSDYRQKEPHGPITDSVARICALAAQAFRGSWRGLESERDFLNAHDIEQVAPYAVIGEKDGPEMQQVDFAQLVPLLVSALGAALERVDRLERRIA